MKHLLISSLFLMVLTVGCSKNANLGNLPGGKTPVPGGTSNVSKLVFSTEDVAFSNTDIGSTSVANLTITNRGNKASGTLGLLFVIQPSPFTLINDNCSNTILEVDGSCTLQVQFRPTLASNSFNLLKAADSQSIDQVVVRGQGMNPATGISHDPPAANNGMLSLLEDDVGTGVLSGTDPNGKTITYEIVTQPTKGSVNLINPATGQYSYTPAANANGSDSFTFKVVNSDNVSSTNASVNVMITPVNDTPVANNLTTTTNEDTIRNGTVSAVDIDGDTLTYSIVAQGTKGSVTMNPTTGSFTYTPNANTNGADSFTFKVNDGTVDSNIATVTVNISPINDVPVANNQVISTVEENAQSGILTGSDADGDSLTFSITTQGNKGTVVITNPVTGEFTYTPNANANGVDVFTFTVNDGTTNSNLGTVTINISPINDAPIADNGSFSTNEDTADNGVLVANDVDGDSLTYTIVSTATKGTIVITNPATGEFTYTPNLNAIGSDSFTFKVNDGTVDSNIATINVTINTINDAPVSVGSSISTAEDTVKNDAVSATDTDLDSLTYSVVTQPANGVVVMNNDGTYSYTPNLNYNGSDSFTFKANDGTMDSNISTVTVTVTPVNDAPVADDLNRLTLKNIPVNIVLTGTDVDGDTLTYTVISNPTNGTLTGTAPNLTYTPNNNYSGSDSLTFKVNDGTVDSNIATVSISVSYTNDAPVSNNQSITTNEDTAYNGTLVATDIDGDTLTYSVVSQGTKGVVTITNTTTGAFTYTPNLNEIGSDSFTFKTNDGALDSNIATVSVTITAENDLPVANNNSFTTNEDTAHNGTLVATDTEGDTLTYSVVSQGSKGVVTITNATTGSYTYTPNANANGSDSFTFRANDGTGNSNTATISVTINSINDAPVAIGDVVSTSEDTAVNITLVGSDVDGDALVYTVVSNPTNGTLTGTVPNLIYTPNTNYNGPDSFTFKVNDGTVDSNTATINITVTTANDLPVAVGDSFTTNEDTVHNGTLVATDLDSDPLTYSVVSQGTKGVVIITNAATGAFTYTPNLNANGADSFTFRANDGTGNSNTATISVTINPINDTPISTNLSFSTNEDTAHNGTLTGSDVDGDTLTYSVVAQGTKGIVSITNAATGAFTYTPNANETGADSFTFRVNDGTVNSNTATVSVTINTVNDAPVVSAGSFSTNEDTAHNGTLIGTDTDGDTLTYSVVANATHGTVVITNATTGAYTYTPNANYNGPDSFTFKANDGTVDSNTATISITVNSVNDTPVANNNSFSTPEDTAHNGTLGATDVDGDALTYSIVAQGAKGTVVITNSATGAFTYTPNANATGADSFTFKVNDGTVDSNTATISVTINSANDLPVANNNSFTTNEDTAHNGTLVATDADGDPLTYSVVAQGTKGTVTITNTITGAYTYTPNLNANGSDSFTFRANDGTGNSNTATISVTITPINDAPVAIGDVVSTPEDTAHNGLLVASDVDGDALIYSVVSQGTKGTVVITNTATGAYTYTPNANATGADSFTFRANDGTVNSNTETINVTINSVNDAPVATNGSSSVDEDTVLNSGVFASDIDGDTLTYLVVSNPTHGSLTLNSNGTYTYTPNANYNGPDSFTYKANDGTVDSNTATRSITVNPINDAPTWTTATTRSLTTNKNVAGNLTVTATDVDGDTVSYGYSTCTNGTCSVNASGLVTFTPTTNYVGSATVTVTCSSTGPLSCSPVTTINVTVVNPNTAPVATNTSAKVQLRTGTVAITLPATDIDGDPLTYSIVSSPTAGTLSGSGNSRTYTLGSWTACAAENATCSFTGTKLVKYGSATNYIIQTMTNGTTCSNAVFSDPDPIASKSCSYISLTDSFTFKANDGTDDSNTATVTINYEDWYNQSWTKRKKLVFNTPTSEDLIDFPVLVRLDSTRINYAQVQSQGQDLRFIDSNGTVLAHEIETWNTSGISYVWVKTSIGAMETKNHYIWMYYGNAGAADGQNKTAVWSNGYVAVYHMNQTTGNMLDSTANANNATISGSMTRNISGPLGNSYRSDSTAACATVSHNASQVITAEYTVESWANRNSDNSNRYLIQKDVVNGGSYYTGYSLMDQSGRIGTEVVSNSFVQSVYTTSASTYFDPLNTWVYAAATFKDSTNTVRYFQNGNNVETNTSATGSWYTGSGWGSLNMFGTCGADGFPGVADEIRISNISRTPKWVEIQYLSMVDGLIMYGNEELSSAPSMKLSYVLNVIANNDDGSNIIGGEGWRASGQNNTGTNWPGEENTQDSWAYIRFQVPVSIPSTGVSNAKLKFMGRVYPSGGENWNNASHYLRIYGENSANAPQITAGTQYPGSGITTNATSVLWNSTLSLTWNWADWNTSPDISPLISSIASSYSLNAGNYMQFWLKRGANLSCGAGYWCQVGLVDYAGGSNLSGKLLIEW